MPAKGSSIIPESEWVAIVDRYKECESSYVVAKEYGVSAPTISNVLDKLGVKRIGQYCNHKIEVSEYAYIEQLCREGNSAPIIAAAYGVTVSTIYWILDKLGIKRSREQKIPESAYPAIVQRYKECENARIVGEEYGVAATSIRYILKKLGVEMVGGNPPSLAESLYPAIVKRYKECESSYVVAKEYGVSKRTILDILIKLGVERTGKPRIPTSDYPAIVKRYKECESTITVGREYGVDDTTIGRILKKLGVETTGNIGVPDALYPAIAVRYKECQSTYIVAEEYGVCHHSILKILEKLGVERTGRSNRKISRSSYPAIVNRYKERKNKTALAEEFGTSAATIHRILIRTEVERTEQTEHGIIPTNTTKADHLRTLAANGYIFEI